MKTTSIIGIILIVLGGLALAYQGITFIEKEEIVDIGPIELNTEHEETIPLPPILGIIAIAGGIGMLIYGSRKGA